MSKQFVSRILVFFIVVNLVLLIMLAGREIVSSNSAGAISALFFSAKDTAKPALGAYVVSDASRFQQLIDETLDKDARQQVANVILLTANHTDVGKGRMIVNDLPWNTPAGLIQPIEVSHPNPLSVEEHQAAFLQNDTIRQMAPGIRRAFPQARLLAVMQGDNAPDAENLQIADELTRYFSPDNTVLIVCADWKDAPTADIAAFQLTSALEVMRHQDIDRVARLNTTSRAVLTTAMKMAANWGYGTFQTTQPPLAASGLNGYLLAADASVQPITLKATTLIFGDVMLDRFMRRTINQYGFDYLLGEQMKRFMHGADVTMVNFEGAMTDFRPYPAHNYMMSFTSDPANAPHLAGYGVNLATLANNHSLNFGQEGFRQTREYLGQAGIETFGNPYNNNEDSDIFTVKNIRGMRLAYIGYHELYNPDLSPILEKIAALKGKVDFITVIPHWGAEYKTWLPAYQQQSARKLIDAGADLIIAHHPHVVQPMEVYKGKMIFYSLGNFLFDQRGRESVRTRLAVGVTYECSKAHSTDLECADKQIEAQLFPMMSNYQYQVALMNESAKQLFYRQFMAGSKITDQYAMNR